MMKYRYDAWEEDSGFDAVADVTPDDENCSICLQSITNPMGQECYLNHVNMWLMSQGMSEIEIEIIRKYIKKRLPKNNLNREMCVTCGNEYLSVCSYCFVLLVSRVLSEFSFARSFEEDFEYMFSYKGVERDEFGRF